MKKYPFTDENVAFEFGRFNTQMNETLLSLRSLIYEEADKQEILLEESLKWGQPSYKAENGTPIRISVFNEDKTKAALYVSCNTTIINDCRLMFDNVLNFSGNRAIILNTNEEIPKDKLTFIINKALNYYKTSK